MYLLEKMWTWQIYRWWIWHRRVSFSEGLNVLGSVFACEIRGAFLYG